MDIQPNISSEQQSSKKLILSLGLIIISIIYAVWQRFGGTPSTVVTTTVTPSTISTVPTQPVSQVTTPSSTPTKTPPVTTTPTPTPVSAPQKPAGQYTDGSYTGTAVDAYYGTVQVKAIVQNGRLADVQFIQYPNDRSNSRYINSQAMPLLTQEAIQAQNAQVDGVSGATFTSQAFEQSLASALVKAKA